MIILSKTLLPITRPVRGIYFKLPIADNEFLDLNYRLLTTILKK